MSSKERKIKGKKDSEKGRQIKKGRQTERQSEKDKQRDR